MWKSRYYIKYTKDTALNNAFFYAWNAIASTAAVSRVESCISS
jgi:hypothetical protein